MDSIEKIPSLTPALSKREREEKKRVLGWLWLGAWLVFLAVQIPGLGNIDTARRLQYTRSFWTSEPPARAEEFPEFGVHGRDGVIYPQTGVGQSLAMLPADLVASAVEKLFAKSREQAVKIRSGVVATLTFPALNALTLAVVCLWLMEMGFGANEAVVGALGLLLGTTFVHYGQVHMENSLEDALLFLDALFLWRWLRKPEMKWVGMAAAVVACAMLVRVTTLGGHGGIWLVICGASFWRRDGSGGLRFRQMLLALPIFLAGVAIDRVIQFEHFGQWSGNYMSMAVAEHRALNPAISERHPFDGDFWSGALGPLISAHRSVFVYDPLLVVLVLAVGLGWKRVPEMAKLALAGGVVGFLVMDLFYARYAYWWGGACWGNRFTLMPIHFVLALALPLAMRCGLLEKCRGVVVLLCGVAFTAQVLSVSMPASVEDFQPRGPEQPAFVLGQRTVNVGDKILGRQAPAGIPAELWRINLFPSTLSGGSAVRTAGLWIVWIGLLTGAGAAIRNAMRCSASSERKL